VDAAPKVGDVAETKIAGKWARVVVEEISIDHHGVAWLRARRLGKPESSRRVYPAINRHGGQFRPTPDPVTANVFADFLDENGEPAAAEKLRKAFPMGG
jgi:hypothetical protein